MLHKPWQKEGAGMLVLCAPHRALPACQSPPKYSTHRGMLLEDTEVETHHPGGSTRQRQSAGVWASCSNLSAGPSSPWGSHQPAAAHSGLAARSSKSWQESPTASFRGTWHPNGSAMWPAKPCRAARSALPWSWGGADPPREEEPSPQPQAHQDMPRPSLGPHAQPAIRDG